MRHGGGGTTDDELPFPVIRPPQRAVARIAASGRYRAVIAGISGRVALPAAYAGARAGRVPFVLWATIWRHPRTPAHALSYLPLRHIYRHADAIATYGPHVSAYVRTKHPRGPVFEAPQAVDAAFWGAEATPDRRARLPDPVRRPPGAGEGLRRPSAGRRRGRHWSSRRTGTPEQLRNLYAGSDVVVVPSLPTRDFLEPWGLVVNEAFHQGVPVIATDAVGAAAGGLVQHERTGLIVPAGDARALRAAIHRLHDDADLRHRLGDNARDAVAEYTFDAWAQGMSRALAAAASVNSPMRRTIFMALLAACCSSSRRPLRRRARTEILRDCDGRRRPAGRLLRLGDAQRPQQHADRARRVRRLP